jgi:LytS/YehU family sensor histidine kinase
MRAANQPRTRGLYLRALLLAPAITALHIALSATLTLTIQPWTPLVSYSLLLAAQSAFVYLYPVDLLVSVAVMAGGYIAAMSQLRVEVARANLEALRLEIRPHFLFNTLNSISALIRIHDNERALSMLVGLSDLMRTSLERPPSGLVTVDEELALLQRYVAIQQVRFAERVSVAFDIDDDSRRLGIPMLLLQPLVENAYRHGVKDGTDRLAIRISARASAGQVAVAVTDDGGGPPDGFDLETDAGAGLRNVTARLRQTFGDAARLALHPRHPHGAVAEMVFPAVVPPIGAWPVTSAAWPVTS